MTNRIYGRTTAFFDAGPDSHHSEMENHRKAAIEELGGHVHFVGSTNHTLEMFSEKGAPDGIQSVMTTRWQLAPAEVIAEAPAAE